MRRAASNLKAYRDLCKIRIAALSAFSSAAAFLLASMRIDAQIAGVLSAVFLLACGSSALNQYMDRGIDERMGRTRMRPIPSGRVKALHALLCSLLLLSAGALVLFFAGGPAAGALGLFAVLWYNGIYTWLKQRTTFAIIIGSLTGAIPPAIGWLSGGGAVSDPMLYCICLFLFIWQVPHSLIFIMHYGREYEQAGLPSLTAQFSKPQLLRITFIWICATSMSCLLMVSNGMVRNLTVNTSLFVLSLWLIVSGARFVAGKGAACFPAFRRINIYLLAVVTLLAADRLLP